MLALIAPASGQTEYHIRINDTESLLAHPGTQTRKVATILPGEILTVVGQTGSWLQIDWRGQDAWLQTLAEYSIVAPAASGLPPAQDAGDSCYPHDVAYAMRATTIKVSYGLTQRTVGQAAAGEQFAIIESRLYGAECWVETSSGWLFGVYLRNTADPPLASEAAPSPAAQDDDDGCYPHEVAYATRDTTIKESYGFAQRPVGQAAAGKQFAIIGSRLYGAVCWVETGEGWLFSN